MKSLINKNFESLSILTIAVTFSSFLLLFRIKYLKSFYFLFLIWNIILAIVPYAITMYLKTMSFSKISMVFWFCIWLLFLPNAPYIITDLLHLKVSSTSMLWLDVLVILSFALTGLLLFYLTLRDMTKIIEDYYPKLNLKWLTPIIFFLCAFGVYLGRFIRYNSWEIISNPMNLLSDIFEMIVYPNQNIQVWIFTLGFGLFIWVGYSLFNRIYSAAST